METRQLLKTKLHIPEPRPALVSRPRLIGQLNEGLTRKLTLISAPPGFGKTTLVSEWVANFRFSIADSGLEGKPIENRKSPRDLAFP